jgi:hypothetical protein
VKKPSRAIRTRHRHGWPLTARNLTIGSEAAVVGNLAIVQLLRSVVAGSPLDNQDQQRSQPVRCAGCEAKAPRFGVQARCAEYEMRPQARCPECTDESPLGTSASRAGCSVSPSSSPARRAAARAALALDLSARGAARRRHDFSFLARRFDLAGGDIKTVALDAAFVAADERSGVTMSDLIGAVARQMMKQEQPIGVCDFKQYYRRLVEAAER